MSSIKKNFSYNIIYQILIIILPLVTAPYVARVIGAEGNGIYSYTYSIVQYFALFAMLGLNNYGNRTIAKCRDNKEKLSKEFCSIYFFQLCMSAFTLMIYIVYICTFGQKYFIFALIQMIYLLSTCFDINWLFFGLEKFKLTVTRNIIIRILSTIFIFIFVKTEKDLILYTILMSGSHLLSQILLWPFLKREVNFVRPNFKDVIKHLKPNFILFIPVIAVSIYKIMDKIMLGNMTNINNVGYYEYAERIINIPLGVITALGTVMLPRISNMIAKGEKDNVKYYIDKSMQFMAFLSIPICFGLITVAPNFIPIFLGNEFKQTGIIIQYLAITILFISWANIIRTQYLIPNEKDKTYIISVIIGAIVNYIINIILIPIYQGIGAAIGTIGAELSVMMYQTYIVRKELNIKKYMRDWLKFLVNGIIMFVIIILMKNIINSTYILIPIQILLGAIIYLGLNYKYILSNIKYVPFLKKLQTRKI